MPPKKNVAAAEGAEAESGPFRWTLENERKLFVLIQGRYPTSGDYERLLTQFPGTNLKGIQIKCSRFRVEQRKLYDEYGWTLPESGVKSKGTPNKAPATPRKNRAAGDDDDEATGEGDGAGDGGTETPKKETKPPAKRAKKELVKEVSSDDDKAAGEGENNGETPKKEKKPRAKRVKKEPVKKEVPVDDAMEEVEDDIVKEVFEGEI
ncbi:hypothetical protein EJ02DRAFT_430325 [Clathrospora elynae]|uniref:Uncharacterized protein n=1 Tax=Clathrospora elynae TaxID=706981 RepID=A0A6A5T4P4_9PLEO|nr:hypothetical protein EJ02DRAFT_430325 [Clathrospora elynae]